MSVKTSREIEIDKIKRKIWYMKQDNLRREDNIEVSYAREDEERRATLEMQSRFPTTPNYDPSAHVFYRKLVRKWIAETEVEIAGLLAQLEIMESEA